MYGEWNIETGDEVFVEATDKFYKQFLRGWYNVDSVVPEKGRFTIKNDSSGEKFKMFRNKHGMCCVVEHEFDRYGESTWDQEKQQYRFIFVPVDFFVKISK